MRKVAFIIVGPLLGAILLAFALTRPSAPVSVGVGFLGYTNGVTGGRFARFGFTNQSGITIRRWGHLDLEVKKSIPCTFNNGPFVLLSPGQAEVILVALDAKPAFLFQRAWRAIFYWRRENWRTRFDVWVATSPSVRAIRGRVGVRVQGAPSEWINP
jgi:hypothetical protein